MLIEIIKTIMFLDIMLCVISWINAIPIGTPWISPRLPLIVTLIIKLIQAKQKKKAFYCNKCNKNLTFNDIERRCEHCRTTGRIKSMGLSGIISYKCPNKKCKTKKLLNLFGPGRTRLSAINLYKDSHSIIVCKYCKNPLQNGTVVNLSLYSGTEKLAMDYRENFFYNALGPAKSSNNVAVNPLDVSQLSGIKEHYENGTAGTSVPTHPITIRLKTENQKINQTTYHFRIAVKDDSMLKLRQSEGIILLLDGKSNCTERQTVIDHFLVDLQVLNTQSATWLKPVLVGICANGVPQLESAIDSGIMNAEDSEQRCRQFLLEQNNSDVVNHLYTNIENIHFFLYRTGTVAEGTEGRIFNVIQPAQSLLYHAQSDMRRVWLQEANGYCPLTRGKKL